LHKINLFLPLLRNCRDFFQNRNHFVQKSAVFNVEDKMLLCAVVRKSTFRIEFLHNRLCFRNLFHKNRVVAHKKNRLFVQVSHIFAEHLAAVHLAVSFNLPAHKHSFVVDILFPFYSITPQLFRKIAIFPNDLNKSLSYGGSLSHEL